MHPLHVAATVAVYLILHLVLVCGDAVEHDEDTRQD